MKSVFVFVCLFAQVYSSITSTIDFSLRNSLPEQTQDRTHSVLENCLQIFFLNCFEAFSSGTYATRFCKISPLWQKLPSLWPMIDGSFLIWQNAEPTLAICDTIWLIFTAANGQILKNNITIIWSHLRVLTYVYLLHL